SRLSAWTAGQRPWAIPVRKTLARGNRIHRIRRKAALRRFACGARPAPTPSGTLSVCTRGEPTRLSTEAAMSGPTTISTSTCSSPAYDAQDLDCDTTEGTCLGSGTPPAGVPPGSDYTTAH